MIAAIVLAAGKSVRMGRPKLLLWVEGRSIIRAVVGNVLRSRVDEVIVVLGHRSPQIRGEVDAALAEGIGASSRLRLVDNPRYEEGQSTSLKAGLLALDGRCKGVLVLMGDQPFVGPDVIDELIDRFLATGAPVVLPEYAQGRASPVVFARELFPELLSVTGDKGGREVVTKYLNRADIVRVPSILAGRDVDTLEDYQELCNKGGAL